MNMHAVAEISSDTEDSIRFPRLDSGRWYSLYGMKIWSELSLPAAEDSTPPSGRPDINITYSDSAEALHTFDESPVITVRCKHGTTIGSRYDREDGYWLWNRAAAYFHISFDGRAVVVYPYDNADPSLVGLLLLGEVLVFALNMRGRLCLHASAIATPHGAAAFLGTKGQGKSTMAAGFLRNGGTLLTDDVLPLEDRGSVIVATPSHSTMKLWQQTAVSALDVCDDLPHLFLGYDKRFLLLDDRYPIASDPTPLAGIYLLERYDPSEHHTDDIEIRAMSQPEALATLLAQTAYGFLLRPAEAARFLSQYVKLVRQAPVKMLRYPSGFEYQERVSSRILAEMEAAA